MLNKQVLSMTQFIKKNWDLGGFQVGGGGGVL